MRTGASELASMNIISGKENDVNLVNQILPMTQPMRHPKNLCWFCLWMPGCYHDSLYLFMTFIAEYTAFVV